MDVLIPREIVDVNGHYNIVALYKVICDFHLHTSPKTAYPELITVSSIKFAMHPKHK